MPKALLTDIDGTLVDSNALHAEAWRRTFEHFGIETDLGEMWSQIGKGGDKVIPIYVPKEDLARLEEPIKKFRKDLLHRDYMPRVVAFAQARDLLVRVRKAGLRIALATSSQKEDLEIYSRIINGEKGDTASQPSDSDGIADLINEAATSTDAEQSKPEADIFAAALEKLGISKADAPTQAVALGDTPWDAQASGKLGIPSIGLTCGGWKRQALLDAGCTEVWQDPADLLLHFDKSILGRK